MPLNASVFRQSKRGVQLFHELWIEDGHPFMYENGLQKHFERVVSQSRGGKPQKRIAALEKEARRGDSCDNPDPANPGHFGRKCPSF